MLSPVPRISLKNRHVYVLVSLHVYRLQKAPLGRTRAQRRVSSYGEHSLEETCRPFRGKEKVLMADSIDADRVLATNDLF